MPRKAPEPQSRLDPKFKSGPQIYPMVQLSRVSVFISPNDMHAFIPT